MDSAGVTEDDMSDHEKIAKAVYDACLEAAIAMGDDLKGLSWFGRSSAKAAAGDERKAA